MYTKVRFTLATLAAIAALLTGCGPQPTPETIVQEVAVEVTRVVEGETVVETVTELVEVTVGPEPIAVADASLPGGHTLSSLSHRPNRLIIKNAEINLLVTDTDTAIDRTAQVVVDYGGYIISSRAWHEQWYDQNYKHATVTLAVPADQFEQVMRRLRGLALRVMDETASGQDVTDEYVDLESRLDNLTATRDRIREFLDQAEDVDEALKVNKELAAVEGKIEQVQGRMNYLFDRAAYSTITVQIDPELPKTAPTPTPTPTPTPGPPWKPMQAVEQAEDELGAILRVLAERVIWFGIVVVPLVGPPALCAWGIYRWIKRRRG
ncbi:MAG: DUF4349 domain-containing protein [Chloroflexi bacterium]|nr:DUF4349 domain-containing protein [Chloroflexota bacterium]